MEGLPEESKTPSHFLRDPRPSCTLGSMRLTPKNERQMTPILLLGIIALTALLLVAGGTPPTAVRDILAIVLPPLVALAAQSDRGPRASG